MNSPYQTSSGSGPPLPASQSPPPPPPLPKRSTPPRLRRRGFTIGSDSLSSSSSSNGSPERAPPARPIFSTPLTMQSTTTTITTTTTAARKQRRRGRSLRKTALLRPGNGTMFGGPSLQPVMNGTGGGGSSSSSGSSLASRRSASPGLKLPPPAVSTAGAVYDSAEDSEGGVFAARVVAPRAYPVRGRSGSVVVVMARTRQEEMDSAADTAYWGWVVLGATWLVFVVGMGNVLGVWEWAWDVPGSPFAKPIPLAKDQQEKDQKKKDDGIFPIDGYYPPLIILTCVMAWVWVVVAWVGMKYFKHAKIQPRDDFVNVNV